MVISPVLGCHHLYTLKKSYFLLHITMLHYIVQYWIANLVCKQITLMHLQSDAVLTLFV